MIEYGEDRGYINSNKELKVHYKRESFWIKVVALNKDNTKVIGILMNSLLGDELYVWGTMVLAEETDSNNLCEVQYIVDCIPNTEEWKII